MIVRSRCAAWMLATFAAGAILWSPLAANATAVARPSVVQHLTLPDGRRATIYSDGHAIVFSKDERGYEIRRIPMRPASPQTGTAGAALPDSRHITAYLMAKHPTSPYAPGWLVVVYRNGVTSPQDVIDVDSKTLAGLRAAGASHGRLATVPVYTNDFALNRTLGELGVDRSARLFAHFSRSALASMQRTTPLPDGQRPLNFANAFKLHVTGSAIPDAVRALAADPGVAYVSPDWFVAPMHVEAAPISANQMARAAQDDRLQPLMASDQVTNRPLQPQLPDNYADRSSMQSMLNAPSDDVMAAFDEISRTFHELPGQGETITNVSVGDVDDTSNPNDPCYGFVQALGPTAELVGGQHYLDMPSMPLIPAYTADADGNLSGSAEVCGVDPSNAEIDLDFSMMAPLPHARQRAGEQGSGFTDLLGIAPGASYRLVVPEDANTTITDIDAAFIGAATQNSRPDVITASLGFGLDTFGFPSRYLEEDPLTESVVSSIVHQYREVVCIAAGDGLRTFTTTAFGPSGGAAPTDVVGRGGTPTQIADDAFSTIPSKVFDSGSIDVGGTTLDDISSAPPQDMRYADLASQHAFPETRWNGFDLIASGFGERVNVSAPADDVIAFVHSLGSSYDAVDPVIEGGTSASSPEVAAAAAIVLQVARLEGHPFTDPTKVRSFLEQTAVPIPAVPQADVDVHVGPQVDVRDAVETIIDPRGGSQSPSVARVGVEQRRPLVGTLDSTFLSYTNRSDIDLADYEGGFGTDADELAWITIAPDWEFVPRSARYRLFVTSHPETTLAVTPWARLLPSTILQAAGLPLVSGQKRKVELTYEVTQGRRQLTSTSFTLGFGPAGSLVHFGFAHAPTAPAVVTGTSFPVEYDIRGLAGVSSAEVLVSEPGRGDASMIFDPPGYYSYVAPIAPDSKGTIEVPVSALHGGGIYGVTLVFNGPSGNGGTYSDAAAVRVAGAQQSRLRPAAPLLSANGSPPGHVLEIPYGSSFQLSYDVTNVPNATGALLEISAAGPTLAGIWNPFNNPNGSIRDHNGLDTGSIYSMPLSGTSGTLTLSGTTVGLFAGMNHVVRVLPMHAGQAVGEAGDVSTITMDGVRPSDGGGIAGNFGIDRSGRDGFLASTQTSASGQRLTSLETFDQNDATIMKEVATGTGSEFFTNGWGIFGRDIGLVGQVTFDPLGASYNLIDTVKSGSLGAAWTPPYPGSALTINDTAANQENDIGAFLLGTGPPYSFFTSDIVHDTFSPLVDIMGPVRNEGSPIYTGIGEDARLGLAMLPSWDFDQPNCGAPTVMTTVDMSSDKVSSFMGTPQNTAPFGIAVDSTTHKVAIPSLVCGDLAIYDLKRKTSIDVPVTPWGGVYTAADPKNGRFLVDMQLPPDLLFNNNALAAVYVYDEQGNVLETLERFATPCFNWVPSNNLQVDPATRTGFIPVGCGAGQLAPFKY